MVGERDAEPTDTRVVVLPGRPPVTASAAPVAASGGALVAPSAPPAGSATRLRRHLTTLSPRLRRGSAHCLVSWSLSASSASLPRPPTIRTSSFGAVSDWLIDDNQLAEWDADDPAAIPLRSNRQAGQA